MEAATAVASAFLQVSSEVCSSSRDVSSSPGSVAPLQCRRTADLEPRAAALEPTTFLLDQFDEADWTLVQRRHRRPSARGRSKVSFSGRRSSARLNSVRYRSHGHTGRGGGLVRASSVKASQAHTGPAGPVRFGSHGDKGLAGCALRASPSIGSQAHTGPAGLVNRSSLSDGHTGLVGTAGYAISGIRSAGIAFRRLLGRVWCSSAPRAPTVSPAEAVNAYRGGGRGGGEFQGGDRFYDCDRLRRWWQPG